MGLHLLATYTISSAPSSIGLTMNTLDGLERLVVNSFTYN
jgi:hypothetical protein